MNTPKCVCVSLTAVFVSAAFVLMPGMASAQSNKFPGDAANRASALLHSDAAKYLSSSGKTALKIISGDTGETSGGAVGFAGIAATEVKRFESTDAQVLVNNPAQDGFVATVNDITSQSETAVAGIGNIVVVT